MIKILHIIDDLGSGGRERQLVELLKALDGDGRFLSNVLVMSKKMHYKQMVPSDTSVFVLERKRKKDLGFFIRLYRFIQKQGPDVVHTWSSMAAVYAAPLTRLLKVIFINGMVRSAHENMSITDERRVRGLLTIPLSDLVVSNTRAGLKAYRVPPKKGICIPNGFDPNRLGSLERKNSIRSKLGIWTNHVVGMVASFSDNKDYDAFINAAIHVLENRRDVTFLAIGEGKNRKKIMKKVKGKHADRILFTGRIRDVESVVNTFDIGVLLTNFHNHGEGISNSIMEYMANGKPVIATDYGGNREIVSHGQNGYLVKNNALGSTAFYIQKIIENQELAKQMGKNGRRTIETKFTMKKMLGNYKALYMGIRHKENYPKF
ncbi:MAG: hypothetical protein CSA23_04275 [Deltaproteobacteria bacterium]|nr:MAG: hypothetical protein CSA23_04275 [Deltaproteobacteria bacterium]